MKVTISSTEAIRSFGDSLARIKRRGDSYVITKNNRPVAELMAAPGSHRGTWGELVKALRELPHDSTFGDDLDRVNDSDQLPQNPWA